MYASSLLQALDAFFGYENGRPLIPFRATCNNCTCCVILPHAIIDGNMGSIIEHIATSDLFYISAMAMFSVSIPNAKEFYEVYEDVLPIYEVNICFICISWLQGTITAKLVRLVSNHNLRYLVFCLK